MDNEHGRFYSYDLSGPWKCVGEQILRKQLFAFEFFREILGDGHYEELIFLCFKLFFFFINSTIFIIFVVRKLLKKKKIIINLIKTKSRTVKNI